MKGADASIELQLKNVDVSGSRRIEKDHKSVLEYLFLFESEIIAVRNPSRSYWFSFCNWWQQLSYQEFGSISFGFNSSKFKTKTVLRRMYPILCWRLVWMEEHNSGAEAASVRQSWVIFVKTGLLEAWKKGDAATQKTYLDVLPALQPFAWSAPHWELNSFEIRAIWMRDGVDMFFTWTERANVIGLNYRDPEISLTSTKNLRRKFASSKRNQGP